MHLLLNALACKNKERIPIWLMRQAGRYLPQYQKLKAGRPLLEIFHDPSLIVEVTLLPVNFLKVDAAILFTDILTVCDGMNIRYEFREGTGPVILDSLDALQFLDPEEAYLHIKTSIQMLKRELKVPLIGFAGAPFTIACYLSERQTSRDWNKTKQWLFKDPVSFQSLIDKITKATLTYLDYQIQSGVEVIQIFDSWANILPIEEFRTFCLKPMQQIVEHVKRYDIPIILFSRGSCFFAKELASLHPNGMSLGWSGELFEIRKSIPSHVALQGNLDPNILYASQDIIRKKVDPLLEKMRHDPGYIFNLGHGVLPDTPVENVRFLIDHIRNL